MSVLVVNCGTSSVKISCFTADAQTKRGEKNYPLSSSIEQILTEACKDLLKEEEPIAIGHRVVHGGDLYTESVVITEEVEKGLMGISSLAPLHMPAIMRGIACGRALFPKAYSIAVFDTAFHARIPSKAALYPIPWDLSSKHGIKRYGFHGIAHAFSWQQYVGVDHTHASHRVITLHLGSGCSLSAIDKGICVDTSMGFTPLDGIMMATRSGELDPAIMSYLCEKEQKTVAEMIAVCNQQSGLLGISGKTADMAKVLELAPTDPRSQLAVDMFLYRIHKKLGSYIAILGGIEALIFSGGMGENSSYIRNKILEGLQWYCGSLEIEDSLKPFSCAGGKIQFLLRHPSSLGAWVVHAEENLYIAGEVRRLLGW